MLLAWTMSQKYRRAPSEVYHITDELAAYCFDEAVMIFGIHIEADLEKAAKGAKNEGQAKMKQQRVMAKWMTPRGEVPKGVYRDPMAGQRIRKA